MLGIGLYGNGGMDTRYPNTVFGVAGSYGPTGVDLNQAFVSVSLLFGMYAPDGVLKGHAPEGFGGQPIELSMDQVEVVGGIIYHWNGRRELEPLNSALAS